MNLQNIFNHLHAEDPEFYERTSPRRATIRTFMKGMALTALPVALGGLFKKAYGQTPTDAIGILNFALTLEYLEAEFYTTALDNAGALNLTGAPLGAIQTISAHETAHVQFLKDTITTLAGASSVAPKPTFDFSGGIGGAGRGNGPFKTAFADYDLFLAVAQTFEDTGVRAYKGQAGFIISDTYNNVLQAALQIHSVEARHAAHIRYMRSKTTSSYAPNAANIRSWITQNNSNIEAGAANAAIQPSYNGENNTTQANVNITNLIDSAYVTSTFTAADLATQAFDEPLTKDAVLEIVKPFIVK